MIQARRLRYLVAAVRSGSFRATAATFGVNPSSVSRQIRQLEHEIGLTLFNRHPGGVFPTVAGHRMAEAARRFMEELTGIGRGDMVRGRRLEPPARTGLSLVDPAPADDHPSFLYLVQCA